MSNIVNDIQTELKKRGYRTSANRDKVLKVLDKTDKPLTVGEIYERALKISPLNDIQELDQSTAYRTIESLAKEGFVKVISLLEGYNRYELERGDHHHHFVCMECQDIIPIHLGNHLKESEKKIEQKIEQEQGVTITSHSLEFFGICKSCKLNPSL